MAQMARQKAVADRSVVWIDALLEAVGTGYINVETFDGMTRGGRLTGLISKKVLFNGLEKEFPVELELNGDPTDLIEIARLRAITIS